MPDWNNATMKQFYQNQTAEVDGYIYADCGPNSGQGYIQINGIHTITICQQSTISQSFSSIFIPVSAGCTFYLQHGGFPGVCKFIPCKKEYQVGMPSYDNEQPKILNTMNIATEPGFIYAQCRSYNCIGTSAGNSPGYLMIDGFEILISKNTYSGC